MLDTAKDGMSLRNFLALSGGENLIPKGLRRFGEVHFHGGIREASWYLLGVNKFVETKTVNSPIKFYLPQ